MKLRIPDYYEDFHCKAGWCRHSCCIGWEINIDEDTAEYYQTVSGKIKERLAQAMYRDEEGDVAFRLGKKKRCPFLNAGNLCDLCIELGEESLSEVCTEYPRFSLWYGDVQQKCLSLSCEEAARLLFSKEGPVTFCEVEYAQEDDVPEETDPDAEWLEAVQEHCIHLLQDRSRPIEERLRDYLFYLCREQSIANRGEDKENPMESDGQIDEEICAELEEKLLAPTYENFWRRMEIFEQLEVLDEEWERVKAGLKETFTADNYELLHRNYQESLGYLERDYENLMVYFTFRYLLNAYYDRDLLSYGRMAVCFAQMIRDMDVLSYIENGESFSRADRIEVVRIFSKEVEHSEENVEFVREELLFL